MKLNRRQIFNWKPVQPAGWKLEEGMKYVGAWAEPNHHLRVLISMDEGLWHLSISHPKRYPTWDEIYEARYRFIPEAVQMVMHLPPRQEYVNVHQNCFHLFEQPPTLLAASAFGPSQEDGEQSRLESEVINVTYDG